MSEGWHPAQPLVNLDISSEAFLKILIIRWIKKNKHKNSQSFVNISECFVFFYHGGVMAF